MEFNYYTNPVTGDATWDGEQVPAGTIVWWNGQYWILVDKEAHSYEPGAEDNEISKALYWAPAGSCVTDVNKFISTLAPLEYVNDLKDNLYQAIDNNFNQVVHWINSQDSNNYGLNLYAYETYVGATKLYNVIVPSVGLLIPGGTTFEAGKEYKSGDIITAGKIGQDNGIQFKTSGVTIIDKDSTTLPTTELPSIENLLYYKITSTKTESGTYVLHLSIVPLDTGFTTAGTTNQAKQIALTYGGVATRYHK